MKILRQRDQFVPRGFQKKADAEDLQFDTTIPPEDDSKVYDPTQDVRDDWEDEIDEDNDVVQDDGVTQDLSGWDI